MALTGSAQEVSSIDGTVEMTVAHAYSANEMTKVEETVDTSVASPFDIQVGIADLVKVEYFAVKNSGTVPVTLEFRGSAGTPESVTFAVGESLVLGGKDVSPSSPSGVLMLLTGDTATTDGLDVLRTTDDGARVEVLVLEEPA